MVFVGASQGKQGEGNSQLARAYSVEIEKV